jgi:hypothetical protein
MDVRTTKPISTISFNSANYLRSRLNELVKAKKLSFWAFITHKPEDDEGGKKEHHHVYAEPAKMLQTDDLREYLKEFDPARPDKPKGCLKWTSSKFDSWYLYALHDKRYLASKGESRKFHYLHDDIQASDDDDLLMMSRQIDLVSLSPYADMQDAIEHGLTFAQYFKRGTVPLPQIKAFQTAWEMLASTSTDRNGRKGHAMSIDEETGEVIDDD